MEEMATTKRCKGLSAEEIHLRARKIGIAFSPLFLLLFHGALTELLSFPLKPWQQSNI